MDADFDNKIQEIVSRVNIFDIVSDVVHLKKSGANFFGLCPFHAEKSPSFSVSPDKGLFYCFGCGTGGNIFTFLMKAKGMTFQDALEHLAKKTGVDLPKRRLTKDGAKKKELKTQIYEINALAAGYFQTIINSPEGKTALNYIRNERGLNRETIDLFKIGYAPDKWNGLANFFAGKGISNEWAEKAGLIAPRQSGGYYDVFRKRIIFPIQDIDGNITGFGGRILGNEEPKYLNTQETPVFVKGRTFYGMNITWPEVRRTGDVFIVEGYFDLIALVQSGINNVLAPLGTALTANHINSIKGYVKRAYMLFDSDNAGMRASERVLPLFLDSGIDACIVKLPQGDDPDTFVKREGASGFAEKLKNTQLLWEFYLNNMVSRSGPHPWKKSGAIDEILRLLSKVSHPVTRSIYVKEVAEKFGVKEQAVLHRLGTREITVKEDASVFLTSQNKNEKTLIYLMLTCPEEMLSLRNYIKDFESAELIPIAEAIFEIYVKEKAMDIDSLLGKIQDEKIRNIVVKIIFEGEQIDNSKTSIQSITRFFELKRIKDEEKRLTLELSRKQQTGNEDEWKGLLVMKHNLVKKKKELLKKAV